MKPLPCLLLKLIRVHSCNSWFLFLLCFCGGLPASAELRAGAAKGSITPDVAAHKVPLGGYAARRGAAATGVHDPVFARALVLSEANVKVGIVSVDLCFLPANVKAEVVARVAAAGVTGLDSEHLLIAATHTHTAPDPLAMHSGKHVQGLERLDAVRPNSAGFHRAKNSRYRCGSGQEAGDGACPRSQSGAGRPETQPQSARRPRL